MFAGREETPGYHPCLVLALADGPVASAAGRALRRSGWDVYLARTGPEARRLARLCGAGMVVLETDLSGESGWLTCDKLVRELPLVKVVLVVGAPGAAEEDLAAFVGASALVDRGAGLGALLREVEGTALPAAG
jgi:DNA-binding response OmpR family regulator